MTILIISDNLDAHADAVEEHLNRHHATFFRLNLDQASLENTKLTYQANEDVWKIKTETHNITDRDITAIWSRRLSLPTDPKQEPGHTERIWRGEWTRTLHWFYYSIQNRPWFPPFANAIKASHKLVQFREAKKVGLEIPPFILSNSKPDILKFATTTNDIALKSLAQDVYPINGDLFGLFVNRLSPEELQDFSEKEEAPIFLQQYMPKSFEVRVTTVGNRHFACKIESQCSPRTQVDWRRYDLARTPHSDIELPNEIANNLTELLKRLGLNFGGSDFIVTEDGKWFFLEVNPNGQWLWLESLTGQPISQAISNLLIEMSSNFEQ